MGTPDTPVSLILRLPDAGDAEAWNEFVGLYRPLIFSLARRGGLQQADAEELTQEVLQEYRRCLFWAAAKRA